MPAVNLGFNFLTPLLTIILSKQNQATLPIIIEVIENMKKVLPECLHTLNTVPLNAIHSDGVVGLRNVIKNPVKNPLEACLKESCVETECEFFAFSDILVDIIKTIPEIIQNKL